MQLAKTLLALTGALVLAGCDDPALISLDPAVTDQDAAFDANLPGTWQAGDGGDLCIIRRGDGNSYTVTYVSDGSARKFDAGLFQSGQAEILDLTPAEADDFQLAGHVLVRVWSASGSLRWSYLDSPWIRQQAGQELPVREGNNGKTVLTAHTAALRGFLSKYAADDKAHGDVVEWQRLP